LSLGVLVSDLRAFEERVQRALQEGSEGGVEILGYGEVTTVLALETDGGRFACKRVTPFPESSDAHACAGVIRRYIEELRARGVDVVETEVHLVPGPARSTVVYCVQPSLPSSALGPAYMRSATREQAIEGFRRILTSLENAVDATCAPDGQLSNWAFLGDRLVYVDVSSPFLRDERGNNLLDWSQYARSLPAPLRLVLRTFLLDHILDKYFTLRGQAIDFLGNLRKERLDHLTPVFLEIANRQLALSPPVTMGEVAAYYREDARTYALIERARRLDRWVYRHLRRKPYPYFLPPRIERNL